MKLIDRVARLTRMWPYSQMWLSVAGVALIKDDHLMPMKHLIPSMLLKIAYETNIAVLWSNQSMPREWRWAGSQKMAKQLVVKAIYASVLRSMRSPTNTKARRIARVVIFLSVLRPCLFGLKGRLVPKFFCRCCCFWYPCAHCGDLVDPMSSLRSLELFPDVVVFGDDGEDD